MKAKLNLSGDGIKQFFLFNGEKIVLGATALILLLFLYGAITAKPLEDAKSPDALRTKATQISGVLDSNTPEPPKLPVTDFSKRMDSNFGNVSSAQYGWQNPINPPVSPELKKRIDPELYAPEQLRVAGGIAAVVYQPDAAAVGAAPAGGGLLGGAAAPAGAASDAKRIDMNATYPGVHTANMEPRRKGYAIVTGAVPVEKQSEEYRKRLDPAFAMTAVQDPAIPPLAIPAAIAGQADAPHYFYFRVERAEVTGPDDKNLKWTPLSYRDAVLDIAKWGVQPPQTPEIVDPAYRFEPEQVTPQLSAYMTWPLPPMYLKDWGLEASHPLVRLINSVADATQPALPDQPNTTDVPSDLGGDAAQPGAAAMAGGNPAGTARGAAPPVAGRTGTLNEKDTRGGGMMPGRGPLGGPMPAVNGFGQPGINGLQQTTVPYKLFRFVDLSAEPGKTYRYRVQVLLYNPNYGLKPECLDVNVKPTVKYRETPWSEPTAAVTIPAETRLLADTIAAGGKAKVKVLSMVKAPPSTDNGGMGAAAKEVALEVMKEYELQLGQIAEVTNATFDGVADISAGVIRKLEKVSIDTNEAMLLDFRNEDPVGLAKPRGAGVPAEMLFVDASGKFIAADAASDSLTASDFKTRTNIPVADTGIPTPTPTPGPKSREPTPPRGTGTRGPIVPVPGTKAGALDKKG